MLRQYNKALITNKNFLMNLYYKLYCRIFYWYKKYSKGKESKSLLRYSAIIWLSALFLFNSLSLIFVISLVKRQTPLNEWIVIVFTVLILIVNNLVISKEKSDKLLEEYNKLIQDKKEYRKINTLFIR